MRAFAAIAALTGTASAIVFSPGDAPTCKMVNGHTRVYYSHTMHPSFKCTYSGGDCTCAGTHPTHHKGKCRQFDHAGKTHSFDGDCTNSGLSPINGDWSGYGAYTACSLTCGGGSKTRTRTCTNPAPAHGGAQCIGDATETSSCNNSPCPIDGTWSAWSNWGSCSKLCGGGTQTATRTCNGRAYGGADCVGNNSKTQACNTHACPINGNWGGWGGYGGCNRNCGGGNKYRYRSCNSPAPAHGGAGCAGSSSQAQSCNTKSCVCSSSLVKFGNKFIQIGDWRFGDVDGNHFSMAYKGSRTAQIYRSDGTLHPGPRSDFTTWSRGLDAGAPGISFGDRFIQIGSWRICDIDGNHASVCTTSGKTAQIFRADGTLHRGPRNDFCCNRRAINNNHPNAPTIGDRYIQIGRWRFGDIDGYHASASTNYHGYVRSAQIWRGDGTLHGGHYRGDWHCYAWSHKQCGRSSQVAGAKVCANK